MLIDASCLRTMVWLMIARMIMVVSVMLLMLAFMGMIVSALSSGVHLRCSAQLNAELRRRIQSPP